MRERRVAASELTGDMRVIRDLAPGTFVLESSSGRRKGTGSFTHLQRSRIPGRCSDRPARHPLVQPASDGDADRAEKELLDIRVCDPAMGSGAFLVQAARVLGRGWPASARFGRALASRLTRFVQPRGRSFGAACTGGPEPPRCDPRQGVAVARDVQRGRPLTFLDAHLRVGDSSSEPICWHRSADATRRRHRLAEGGGYRPQGISEEIAGPAGEAMTEQLKARKALTVAANRLCLGWPHTRSVKRSRNSSRSANA